MNSNLDIIGKNDFDDFFKILDASFPDEERRNYNDQIKLLDEMMYKIYAYKDQEKNINAFIASWNFDKFNFIEHFAVNPNIRGNGLGTKMLNNYMKECKKTIFLEVEPPKTDIARRRINFYKRLGFYLNDYDYVQLPLQKQHKPLPLMVMTYPRKVNKDEFENYKRKVYKHVYKAKI
ncbi:GNAT family N-acetyltransferase [Clostridium sp. CTA-5]